VYIVAKNGSTLAPLGWNFLNTMTYIGPINATPRYFFAFYEENIHRLSLYTNDVLAGFNSSYSVPLNSNAIVGFAASATSNYLFFNGSNTAFTSTGAPPSANDGTWFFFGDDSSDYVTDENIYEFVGFNTLLTTAQQQAVEGYLATKWGLQSSLSNGHPFKTTPLPFEPTLGRYPPYPTSAVSNPEFEPHLIEGCQLWLDASDTTTITGTTAVSAWTDKSGNGNNTTIFGTPNSTYGTINNVKAMWFNGSSGTYGIFSNTGATVSGFVVGTMNSATTGYGRMIALGNNPGNDDLGSGFCPLLLRQSGNQAFCTRRFQTDRTYSSYTFDAPFLASIIYDGTNGNLYVNGSTIVQFGSTGNFGYSNYSVGCGIFSIANNTIDTWTGFVGEVILYRSALTSIQQQQVEAYLAKKWKLNSILSKQNIYAPGSYLTFVNAPRIPALPMRRAVQTNKFLPSQIAGLQLWLDAADATTITGTTSITAWRDKSGSNNNAIFSGTNPSYVAASNAVITANGNQQFTVPAATIATSTGSCSIFMVYGDQQTQGGGYAGLFSSSSPSHYFVQSLIRPDGGSYESFGSLSSAAASNVFNTTNPIIYNANYTYNSTVGSVRLNGTTYKSPFSSAPVPSGAMTLSGFGWNGSGNVRLYEVITYVGATPLTSTQQQQIEGYLGWKWKLKASLPPDHPFFLIPPLPFP